MNHVPEVDSIGTRAPVGHSVSGNKKGGEQEQELAENGTETPQSEFMRS